MKLGSIGGPPLRVVRVTQPEPPGRLSKWRRGAERRTATRWGPFEVFCDAGRVGLVDLRAPELARIEWRGGGWRLRHRRPSGWEFVIETLDGRHAG